MMRGKQASEGTCEGPIFILRSSFQELGRAARLWGSYEERTGMHVIPEAGRRGLGTSLSDSP